MYCKLDVINVLQVENLVPAYKIPDVASSHIIVL